MKRIATLVVVGLTAAAAAGCGGLSKSDYQKKLASVGKDVRRQETDLSRAATSGGSASSQLDKLRAGLRKAADELSKITPPGDAKSDNNKLVSGLRELANELGPIEKAAKSHNASALQSALSTLQSSGGVTKIRDAINDLKSKGYSNIGPGTRSTT
jgi:uncharacterized phage infection (PIP) family protein YhgE